ncbi:MAG: hypothetical protein QGI78_04585 [Phycisphaerales bacterium]|jgi:hypothetical protein|nr:hypothetical protein [Phycisphaerales bacterium]
MTKIITIIIIVSTIWSAISGIIEKKKRDKKAVHAGGHTQGVGLSVDPQVQVQNTPSDSRIDALRKRPKQRTTFVGAARPIAEKLETVAKQPRKKIDHIDPLHDEACPLQSKASKPSRNREMTADALYRLLRDHKNARTAIVLSEVLGKPVSQRS